MNVTRNKLFKNERARVVTTFSHYKHMGCFQISRAANSAVFSPIWPNFELFRDFMVILVTCKNEKDPIKNEGARVFITLYINFLDAQGQITPVSVMVSSQNLNSFKLLYMSMLPARIKMIQSIMKELEWSQQFSILSLREFFQTLKGS